MPESLEPPELAFLAFARRHRQQMADMVSDLRSVMLKKCGNLESSSVKALVFSNKACYTMDQILWDLVHMHDGNGSEVVDYYAIIQNIDQSKYTKV